VAASGVATEGGCVGKQFHLARSHVVNRADDLDPPGLQTLPHVGNARKTAHREVDVALDRLGHLVFAIQVLPNAGERGFNLVEERHNLRRLLRGIRKMIKSGADRTTT